MTMPVAAAPTAEVRERHLLALPNDVLFMVVDHLEGNIAQAKLRKVCRKLKSITEESLTYRKKFSFKPNIGDINFYFKSFHTGLKVVKNFLPSQQIEQLGCDFVFCFKNHVSILNDANKSTLIKYGSNLKSLVARARFVIAAAARKEDLSPKAISVLRERLAPCREMSIAYLEAESVLLRSPENKENDFKSKISSVANSKFDQSMAMLQGLRSRLNRNEQHIYQCRMKDIISEFVDFPCRLSQDNLCRLKQLIGCVKSFGHFTMFLKRLRKHDLPMMSWDSYIFDHKMSRFKFMHDIFTEAERSLNWAELHHQRLPPACP